MNLIKLHDNLFVNPHNIDYIEQRNGEISVCVSGKVFEITKKEDLDEIMHDLIGVDKNIWGKQHFAG